MMKKVVLFVGLCLLSACLGGYSPKSSFYKLRGFDNALSVVSNKKISIGVNTVDLPDYLNKPQLVSFDEDRLKMQIDETNRWGESLDTMIKRVIADDLSGYLPNAEVKVKSSLVEKFDYLINVQIVKFDMVEDKEAILEAWWYVLNKNGKMLVREKNLLNKENADNYSEFVAAQSEMLNQMSKRMAEKIAGF